MSEKPHLHQLAVDCGAMVLGDPPHYLFTAGQLADLARAIDGPAMELFDLADRLEKSDKPVRIIVDSHQ